MSADHEMLEPRVTDSPTRDRPFVSWGGQGSSRQDAPDPDNIFHRVHMTHIPAAGRSWSDLDLGELFEEIRAQFHQPLKSELPRVGSLLFRVAEGDGDKHPELNRILESFSHFSSDLKQHLADEEEAVLALIGELETGAALRGNVGEAVARMEGEGNSALRALQYMRELTHDFCPPGDACGAYRGVLDALQGLERRLNEHLAIRNNILFPRVLQLHGATTFAGGELSESHLHAF